MMIAMDKLPIKNIILCATGLIYALCVFYGCSLFEEKDKTWKPVKPKPEPLLHTVQWPQETLPMIAKWYTGDIQNTDAIAYGNPTINPERLNVGNKIFIPFNLVKKREPLPREYMVKFNHKPIKPKPQKKKKPVKKPVKPEPPEEEFEFFGPK